MMQMQARLRRIEARARGGVPGRCSHCGQPPGCHGVIVYSDQAEGFPDDPDERCPGCGRRLWFIIEVLDSATGEQIGGGGYR